MQNSEIKTHLISATATVYQALEKLNHLSGSQMTLFVVDNVDQPVVLGSLTDGDVRRAILRGLNLEAPVTEAMHTAFKKIYHNSPAIVRDIRNLRQKGITLLPMVDSRDRLVDVADLSRQYTRLPLDAILMAGGKGTRLFPLTADTPKPLLQIDSKAIIDYNIDMLASAGIQNISVCTGHLSHKIIQHFKDTPHEGIAITCVTEQEPLGTLGGVSLLDIPAQGDTLVMNSDIFTTLSLEDMYLRHVDTNADITVAVLPYQVSVPFAILTTEGDKVTGITEKPSYSHYANSGIYIFKNQTLKNIASGQKTDAPDFIKSVIDRGGLVSYYLIDGTWIDIGTPTDLAQARQLIKRQRGNA